MARILYDTKNKKLRMKFVNLWKIDITCENYFRFEVDVFLVLNV